MKLCIMECMLYIIQHKNTISHSTKSTLNIVYSIFPIHFHSFFFPIWFFHQPLWQFLPITSSTPLPCYPQLYFPIFFMCRVTKKDISLLFFTYYIEATYFFLSLNWMLEEFFFIFFHYFAQINNCVCGLEDFNTTEKYPTLIHWHKNTQFFITLRVFFLNYVFYAKVSTQKFFFMIKFQLNIVWCLISQPPPFIF